MSVLYGCVLHVCSAATILQNAVPMCASNHARTPSQSFRMLQRSVIRPGLPGAVRSGTDWDGLNDGIFIALPHRGGVRFAGPVSFRRRFVVGRAGSWVGWLCRHAPELGRRPSGSSSKG